MKIEWYYNNGSFKIEFTRLEKKELDKIIKFLDGLEELETVHEGG